MVKGRDGRELVRMTAQTPGGVREHSVPSSVIRRTVVAMLTVEGVAAVDSPGHGSCLAGDADIDRRRP